MHACCLFSFKKGVRVMHTTLLGVLVGIDDSVGPLGGVQQGPPGQVLGVAELGVVVEQDQTPADAPE